MTTDTDRTLLELAAKAAGYTLTDGSQGYRTFRCYADVEWNPLTDDGDALRLAVKLHMKVYVGEAYPWDKECAEYSHRFAGICDEDEEKDPYAATRLAIVRAAAAIGEAM